MPLWNPKRKTHIGSLKLEEVRRLRIESALRGGIASLAAIGRCYTICLCSYYPLPLC